MVFLRKIGSRILGAVTGIFTGIAAGFAATISLIKNAPNEGPAFGVLVSPVLFAGFGLYYMLKGFFVGAIYGLSEALKLPEVTWNAFERFSQHGTSNIDKVTNITNSKEVLKKFMELRHVYSHKEITEGGRLRLLLGEQEISDIEQYCIQDTRFSSLVQTDLKNYLTYLQENPALSSYKNPLIVTLETGDKQHYDADDLAQNIYARIQDGKPLGFKPENIELGYPAWLFEFIWHIRHLVSTKKYEARAEEQYSQFKTKNSTPSSPTQGGVFAIAANFSGQRKKSPEDPQIQNTATV